MTLRTNCVRTIQYESPHQLLPGLLVQASFLSTPLLVSTLTHSLIKNRLRRTLYVKQQPTNKQQKTTNYRVLNQNFAHVNYTLS